RLSRRLWPFPGDDAGRGAVPRRHRGQHAPVRVRSDAAPPGVEAGSRVGGTTRDREPRPAISLRRTALEEACKGGLSMSRILQRMTVIAAVVAGALLPGSMSAGAQDFPSKDFLVISAFPAGSGSDIITRHFARHLSQISGRTAIVEN